jgi:hypothetical protein
MGREGKGRQLTIQGLSERTLLAIEQEWRISRDGNGLFFPSKNAYLVDTLDDYFYELGLHAEQQLKEAQNA